MDMASNQPDNLALTAEQLREYSAAFNADRANLVAANAAVSNGILQAATSYRGVRELPRTFSVELKQGSITSQEHSGRCWMFASLNTLRYELMHKWNLDDFEFSESYLFFYDKLEKSNFYLENVLKTLDKTTDSRIFEAVNEGPADDGGWWQMFVALVKKYGLVPKEAYPESSNSRDSSAFEQYLNTKLREFAAELRDAHQAGKSVEELRSLKTGQMSVVYRICAIAMGEPPTSFDLLLRVKDEGKDDAKDDAKASESGTKSGIDSRRQIVEHGITPQEFYAKYVGEDLDDFVSLTNSPLASTPYYRRYQLAFVGNVAEAAPMDFINVPLDVELTPLEKLPIGKGIVKRRGEKLAILNFGTLMPEAAKVAESLNATLVDMRFVKPLDEALILEMAASHEALVTVEENAIMGGAGSGVNEVLMAHRKPVPVLNIGLPDFFIPQGTQEEMRAELGLDAAGMEAKIKAWLA